MINIHSPKFNVSLVSALTDTHFQWYLIYVDEILKEC
jgi:hypothetical protein